MPRTPKYYTYNKKHKLYQIKKRFGDDWKYFGYYKTQKEAEFIVDELKKVDWNVELLPEDLRELVTSNKVKNYGKSKDRYIVIKTCDYTHHNYGSYDTEEEAKKIVELMKKNNWRLSNLSEEELKLIKLNKLKNYKYYYYNKRNNHWTIYRNGSYYGSYKDEETAAQVVTALKQVNWDKNKCPLIDELKIKRPGAKHYCYNKVVKKYQIVKSIKGKSISFGYYDTEYEAQKIVQLLKENNWNKECLV